MTRCAIAAVCLLALAWFVWPRSAAQPPQAKPAPATVLASTPASQPTPHPVPAKPAPPLTPPGRPLENPPAIVKGVYFTGWSAGLRRRVDYLVDLHKTTAINAVVIDIKDYSGNLAYSVTSPEARQYGAVRRMIRDFDALVNRLHSEGVYVVARITVFQDPVLAQARPDLAVHRVSKLPKGEHPPLTADSLWLDRKGLAWIDPASRPAWDYVVSIAHDALAHGADEVNFDYVRFPSDGDLNDMHYPAWDGKTPKHQVIREFFGYLRKQLPGARISADLFGLATVNDDDLGIGQVIEDAYASFDYVCPMVYPSHYARTFLGFPSPAQHPYEVVNYSIKSARTRLEAFSQPQVKAAALRPWIQDFNLGAKYDAAMVKAEIKAIEDALGNRFAGYLVWAPSNVYTRQALIETPKPPETTEGAAN